MVYSDFPIPGKNPPLGGGGGGGQIPIVNSTLTILVVWDHCAVKADLKVLQYHLTANTLRGQSVEYLYFLTVHTDCPLKILHLESN